MRIVTNPVEYLLGCYFHEDWTDDYETLDDLIEDFVVRDARLATRTPQAIRSLLEHSNEDSLKELCNEESPSWDFAVMSGSYTKFFELLLDRIEAQLRLQAK